MGKQQACNYNSWKLCNYWIEKKNRFPGVGKNAEFKTGPKSWFKPADPGQ